MTASSKTVHGGTGDTYDTEQSYFAFKVESENDLHVREQF